MSFISRYIFFILSYKKAIKQDMINKVNYNEHLREEQEIDNNQLILKINSGKYSLRNKSNKQDKLNMYIFFFE